MFHSKITKIPKIHIFEVPIKKQFPFGTICPAGRRISLRTARSPVKMMKNKTGTNLFLSYRFAPVLYRFILSAVYRYSKIAEYDANVITAVKKKIAKKVLKIAAVVCLVFAGLFSAVLLYTGISHPVTRDSISLSAKMESGYDYIILDTYAGKSLSFASGTEDIVNDKNEVCGQKITLYNLQYHNNFTQKNNSCITRTANIYFTLSLYFLHISSFSKNKFVTFVFLLL